MNLDEFIKKWTGKPLEAEDPTNYAQCFDLAFGWIDNLNIPRASIRHLDAFQIFTEPNDLTRQYFELIKNTPAGVPAKGDLVVWGQTVGFAGHVAVFVSGDVNSFISFDQNWSAVQVCRIVQHSYNGVIGWLHPKDAIIQPEPDMPLTDQSVIDFGFEIGSMELQAARSKLRELNVANDRITDLESIVKNLQAQVTILTAKLNNTPVPSPTLPPTNPTPQPITLQDAFRVIIEFFKTFFK